MSNNKSSFLNKMTAWFEKWLGPIAEFTNTNIYLRSISDAFTMQMPLIIVDRLIIKGKHYVNQGTIINLLPTLINNMKPNNGIPSMISTPSGGILSSLFKR